MKKLTKSKIAKIVLYISFIPYILLFVISLLSAFIGFDFMFSTTYGIEGFFACLVILGYLLWVFGIIPVCLIYQIIYFIVKSIKKNKKETEENKQSVEVLDNKDEKNIDK
jgi:hypothetical protein